MPLETAYQPLVGDTFQAPPSDPGHFPRRPAHVIHVTDQTHARWNHIDDLDTFFTRVYQYHQQHGFVCMMTRQCLELFQFFFVVTFSLFLITCVDYDKLFNRSGTRGKTTLSDVLLPSGQCMVNPPGLVVVCLIVAAVFWLLRLIKVGYNFVQFWEIKSFFNTALGISDSDLDNRTWYEVQQRLMDVQQEQQMCIHKPDLTELDIYNRILRFKNYMVAMVNKQVLSLKFTPPILGEVVYLSKGLKYNLELLLFWGPGSPFENNWHLRADYKRVGKRRMLADALSRRILFVGLANLALCPLILLWQLLYSFYNYAEVINREPGSLGLRRWSLYGRYFLRHFNELEHELNLRLNRGYRAANKYLDSFTTPFMEIIAQNVMFVCGAVFAVLLGLTIYDEDVLTVEHVLTLMTCLGGIIAVCRGCIADENLVFAPEHLMAAVLTHVHYMPDHWRGAAHTARVVLEFSQLFQLKAYYLMEELLSPIVTPLILCFRLRHRSLEIVDFFRNFTVEVVGVGDVCSFAQMDVRRHGDPTWAPGGPPAAAEGGSDEDEPPPPPPAQPPAAEEAARAELGKTELSLVHFAITNPGWRPPEASDNYISTLRAQGAREAATVRMSVVPEETTGALFASLQTLGTMGQQFTPIVASLYSSGGHGGSLLASVHEGLMTQRPDLQGSVLRPPAGGSSHRGGTSFIQPPEFMAAEMAVSALYIHELHQRMLVQQRLQPYYTGGPSWQDGEGGASGPASPRPGAGADVSVHYAPPPGRSADQSLVDLGSRTS